MLADQLRTVLAEAKQLINESNRGDRRQLATTAARVRERVRSEMGLMVAGSQTEYVNMVLELAQRQRPREDEANVPLHERLASPTAAQNAEIRPLALKHAVHSYAEQLAA